MNTNPHTQRHDTGEPTDTLETIGQLAGGIAHDFNNVLCGIIGYADMSLELVDHNVALKENLLAILKASERAKNLVQKLLAFSRKGNAQTSDTPLLPVIEEVSDDPPTVCRGGTETILIVGDEQMPVEMTKNLLTGLGYTVTALSDSRAALDFIKNRGADLDLLITDQTMPGMTGIELAKEALKIRNGLPIILCTGFSNGVNPRRVSAIGISKCMMKPFTAHALARCLRDVLENKRKGLSYV